VAARVRGLRDARDNQGRDVTRVAVGTVHLEDLDLHANVWSAQRIARRWRACLRLRPSIRAGAGSDACVALGSEGTGHDGTCQLVFEVLERLSSIGCEASRRIRTVGNRPLAPRLSVNPRNEWCAGQGSNLRPSA